MHIPTAESVAGDVTTDPRTYFDSLTEVEQDRTFTRAGALAIRDGADLGQVVNARRGAFGMSPAGARLTLTEQRELRGGRSRGRLERSDVFGQRLFITSEGTTRRGLAYRPLSQRGGWCGDRRATGWCALQKRQGPPSDAGEHLRDCRGSSGRCPAAEDQRLPHLDHPLPAGCATSALNDGVPPDEVTEPNMDTTAMLLIAYRNELVEGGFLPEEAFALVRDAASEHLKGVNLAAKVVQP